MDLKLDHYPRDGVEVVDVQGEIDIYTAPRLLPRSPESGTTCTSWPRTQTPRRPRRCRCTDPAARRVRGWRSGRHRRLGSAGAHQATDSARYRPWPFHCGQTPAPRRPEPLRTTARRLRLGAKCGGEPRPAAAGSRDRKTLHLSRPETAWRPRQLAAVFGPVPSAPGSSWPPAAQQVIKQRPATAQVLRADSWGGYAGPDRPAAHWRAGRETPPGTSAWWGCLGLSGYGQCRRIWRYRLGGAE